MDNYNKRIKLLIDKYCEIIFKNPNVIGFGRSLKSINGYDTNIPCITVYVKKKIHKSMLSPYNIIPNKFYGVKTDVLQLGDITLCRPALGGAKISLNKRYNKAILGCAVTDRETHKKLYFITSAHGLYSSSYPDEKNVLEPPYSYDSKQYNFEVQRIGSIEKITTQKPLNEEDYSVYNEIDAALIYVGSNTVEVQKKVLMPGIMDSKSKKVINILGSKEVDPRDEISKFDGEFGEKKVLVKTTNLTLEVQGGLYKNQIICDDRVFMGDSGTISIDTKDSKAVGMLMARCDIGSVYNSIDRVLDYFKVDFATTLG